MSREIAFTVTLTIYFAAMLGIAIYAYFKFNKAPPKGDEMQNHFFAGSSFGFWVLMLASFATMFAGSSVVGIPQYTALLGFDMMAKMMLILPAAMAFNMFGVPHTRRLWMVRNWESPTCCIADRYNLVPLTLLNTAVQIFQMTALMTLQFYGIYDICAQMLDGFIDPLGLMIFSAIFVFVCEILGGMGSVSLTDAIQAIIMIFSFIASAVIADTELGGMWRSTEPMCEMVPYCFSHSAPFFMLYPGNGKSDLAGKFAPIPPEQTGLLGLDNHRLFSYYGASMVSYFFSWLGTSPHFTMKLPSAKSDQVMRNGMIAWGVLCPACLFPSVTLGIVKVARFPAGTPGAEATAFAAIMKLYFDLGGLPALVAIAMCCSSICSMMSSADSCVIACSNLMCVDVFRNWAKPDISAKQVVTVSKIVSFCMLIVSTIWAHSFKDDPEAYIKLPEYQGFAKVCNSVMSIGMWWLDSKYMCGWASLGSMLLTFIYFIWRQSVFLAHDPSAPSNLYDMQFTYVFYSFVVQIVGWLILQPICVALKIHDDAARTGPLATSESVRSFYNNGTPGTLTLATMSEHLEGMTHPLKSIQGWVGWAILVIPAFALSYWWDEPWAPFDHIEFTGVEEPLFTYHTKEEMCTFAFCADKVELTYGIPAWAFWSSITLCMTGIVGNLIGWHAWKPISEEEEVRRRAAINRFRASDLNGEAPPRTSFTEVNAPPTLLASTSKTEVNAEKVNVEKLDDVEVVQV